MEFMYEEKVNVFKELGNLSKDAEIICNIMGINKMNISLKIAQMVLEKVTNPENRHIQFRNLNFTEREVLMFHPATRLERDGSLQFAGYNLK